MSEIDQFESVFRSALRAPFCYQEISFRKIFLVTDLDEVESRKILDGVTAFLKNLEQDSPEWYIISGDQFQSTNELLRLVGDKDVDLICTYRNLHSRAWRFPHSLGEFVDVLLQQVKAPVILLPHPEAGFSSEHAVKNTNCVMAMTDHLDQDHALVNNALKFTESGGKLYLAHIEDERYFQKIAQAISKIPTIDTEMATSALREQLLKQPRQYIESCKKVLYEHHANIDINEFVRFGNRLQELKQCIEEFRIDLLALHTKDNEQMAMHGLVYPLAVELRQIPLLML